MKKDLHFNEKGKFKIIQFTDIHYTEDTHKDHLTTKLMRQIIEAEKPDFIIATGDTVYGPDNTKYLEKAFGPMIESGVPWSYTFGNHDTEEGEDYDVLFPMINSLPGCVAYHDEDSVKGVGNHYLEVKNKQGDTKWVLFGIDTGAYNKILEVGGYDYIKTEQSHWYQKTMSELEKKDKNFSALTFMHIPLPEYREVWEMENCYGEKREGICCPRINSGFFTAMMGVGHTKGVFVGHDHINDYMGNLHGITLAYGRATGYNTYSQKDYKKGARMIILDENQIDLFETYLHLEDGTIIEKQAKHNPERIRDEE